MRNWSVYGAHKRPLSTWLGTNSRCAETSSTAGGPTCSDPLILSQGHQLVRLHQELVRLEKDGKVAPGAAADVEAAARKLADGASNSITAARRLAALSRTSLWTSCVCTVWTTGLSVKSCAVEPTAGCL